MASGQIFEIVIGAVIAIIGFFVARTIGKIEETMEKINVSVNELNTKVAVVIEKTGYNERSIEDHDGRIRLLEANKNTH